jgi:hypothetical protein
MEGGIAGRVTVVMDGEFVVMEFDESTETMDGSEIEINDEQSLK